MQIPPDFFAVASRQLTDPAAYHARRNDQVQAWFLLKDAQGRPVDHIRFRRVLGIPEVPINDVDACRMAARPAIMAAIARRRGNPFGGAA